MATILVIDDTPLAVIATCRYLEKEGHKIEFISCGERGLKRARELQPDLILLDLLMPNVDGLQVLEELNLGATPTRPKAPVIVVSGSDNPTDIVRCLDLGALDFVTKPVDMRVLGAKVRVALRVKYAQEVVARSNQHLSLLASVDPLTQMYNRRRLFELSVRELAKAQRFDRDLSVIMLDMDHFKDFNDNFGHATGDQVLQVMARVILRCTRDTDIAGRIGGEEFAICCPETSLEGAALLAERIRAMLAQERLDIDEQCHSVTASFGVSSLCDLDKTFDALLNRADRMMYQAKNSGRNQVLSA